MNSLFCFNFVTETIIEIRPFYCEDGTFDICSDRRLFDLEYVDDALVLTEAPSKCDDIRSPLNGIVAMYGQLFLASKPNIILPGKDFGEVAASS